MYIIRSQFSEKNLKWKQNFNLFIRKIYYVQGIFFKYYVHWVKVIVRLRVDLLKFTKLVLGGSYLMVFMLINCFWSSLYHLTSVISSRTSNLPFEAGHWPENDVKKFYSRGSCGRIGSFNDRPNTWSWGKAS